MPSEYKIKEQRPSVVDACLGAGKVEGEFFPLVRCRHVASADEHIGIGGRFYLNRTAMPVTGDPLSFKGIEDGKVKRVLQPGDNACQVRCRAWFLLLWRWY